MLNKPKPLTNSEFILYASGQRGAGTVNTGNYENASGLGVRLYLKVTAVSGVSPTLDVKIQGKDPASGDYFDIGNFAQQIAAGNLLSLIVYPGITPVANQKVNDFVARTWRVQYTIGGSSTPTVTFSLGAVMLL